VSPALNCGIPLRNWARSMESITLLIGKGGREKAEAGC
jgi:hypothetical protein